MPDGEVTDPQHAGSYSEAIQVAPDFEIGEEMSDAVRFSEFGRRAVLSARQN